MNIFESTFEKHKKLTLAKLNENAPIETAEYELPSHWASYLVNNDSSGLEETEKKEADAAIEDIKKELNATSINCINAEEVGIGDYNNVRSNVSKYTFHVFRKN